MLQLYPKIYALPMVGKFVFNQTMEHIGHRLQQYMQAHSVTQTTVASIFGIKQGSVSLWLRNGRIARKHYNQLVKWSGLPIEYWLGLDPITPDAVMSDVAREDVLTLTSHKEAPLSPRDQALVAMFNGLPRQEQEEFWRALQSKKQYFDALYNELTTMRKAA